MSVSSISINKRVGNGSSSCYGRGTVQSLVSYTDKSTPRNSTPVKGDGYGIPILVFMAIFTWAALSITDYYKIWNPGIVVLISLVVSYLIGIMIKKILAIIVWGGIILSIIGGAIYLFFYS